MQQAKNRHAHSRDEQADQKIPNNKTLQHFADQPKSHECCVPVMKRKQHHGRRTGMALPGQQKIRKERNKRGGQQALSDGADSMGKHVGPTGNLPHLNDVLVVGGGHGLARLLDLFRLLPERLQDGSDFLRVFRKIVGKNNRLVVGGDGDPIEHDEKKNHADERRQGPRNMEVLKGLHQRREGETQQDGKEQNGQHRFAKVGKQYDQCDAEQGQRPVISAFLFFGGFHVLHSTGCLPPRALRTNFASADRELHEENPRESKSKVRSQIEEVGPGSHRAGAEHAFTSSI